MDHFVISITIRDRSQKKALPDVKFTRPKLILLPCPNYQDLKVTIPFLFKLEVGLRVRFPIYWLFRYTRSWVWYKRRKKFNELISMLMNKIL